MFVVYNSKEFLWTSDYESQLESFKYESTGRAIAVTTAPASALHKMLKVSG